MAVICMTFVAVIIVASCAAAVNRIVSAQLVCTDRDMQLHLKLDGPMRTSMRAFVRDRPTDPICSHLYPRVPKHNAIMFRVFLSTCNMQRIQQNQNRFSFSTVVFVSMHHIFISNNDVAYRITCDYMRYATKSTQNVSTGMGIKEVHEETAVDEQAVEDVECDYKLSRAGKSLATIASAVIGEEIEHHWVCRNMRPDQFMYVHDCIVNPEFDTGHDPIIVDSQGSCIVDSLAMGPINYSADGHRASSKHLAYKFAGYPNLLFKCSISICQRTVATCKHNDTTPLLKPPECAATASRETRSVSRELVIPYALKMSNIRTVMQELRALDPAVSGSNTIRQWILAKNGAIIVTLMLLIHRKAF